MGGLGAELFADHAIELVAAACDEPVGEHERAGSRVAARERVARGDRGRERVAGRSRAASREGEARFRFACIADGGCEISAPGPFVAHSRIA